MKNTFKNLSVLFLGLAVMALSFQSCKKKFDEPEIGDYPSLTANTTIEEIQALHTVGESANEISDDLIVEGQVVSSDESGNFFKQLIIQDETGGIEVRIEQNNLFRDYPVGSRVWIRCKGLFVGDYEGNFQLTINANGDRLPEGLIATHIIGGEEILELTPNVVTINEIATNPKLRNTLVQLENVQFVTNDVDKPYADAVNRRSENRTLQDCNGNVILVRSSGYADFAADRTPDASGTITAVYTKFGSDAQLYIRNTSDVAFSGTRCTPSSNVTGNLVPISTVRAAYSGTDVAAPTSTKVKGYVISDRSTGNTVDKNLIIMDENANGGIVVRFSTAHSLDLGSYVEFSVDGGTLSEFKGLLQIEGLNEANFNVISTGNAIPPVTIAFADLIADTEKYESTLIKLEAVTITGDSNFRFNELTNGTNTIDLFTSNFATFTSSSVPTTCQNVTGIVGQYNTDYQIILRNPTTDLEAGSGCQSSGGGGGSTGNETVIGLDSVRILFGNGITSIPGARKITGTIISDRTNGNIFDDNFVIQDATGGIQVRLAASHTYNLGDSVEIVVSGASIGEYKGVLRLGNASAIATSSITSISTNRTVTPRVATVADLLTNAELWESTLVQVQSATISDDAGSGKYGFNEVTDAAGTIDMYTPSSASFHGSAYPTGTVTVTAILSQYDNSTPTDEGYQLRIRNTADIQ